jgi:hypothetical protein
MLTDQMLMASGSDNRPSLAAAYRFWDESAVNGTATIRGMDQATIR